MELGATEVARDFDICSRSVFVNGLSEAKEILLHKTIFLAAPLALKRPLDFETRTWCRRRNETDRRYRPWLLSRVIKKRRASSRFQSVSECGGVIP